MALEPAARAALAAWAVLACLPARAQTPQTSSGATGRVIGEVVAFDAAARRISLKTDKAEVWIIVLPESATLRRVPPGAADLAKAAVIAFSELARGDRVLALGQAAGGENRFEARTVIVMTRSDLVQKQQQELEGWQKRGVSGTVADIDTGGGKFTVKSGAKTVTVQPSANTEFRRYAPDSVKFSDARISSLAEVKAGDMIRVLGDRSDDGTSVKAERVVSGTFRQIAATISSINPDASEIVVKDLASKKTVTLRLNSDSSLKKLPPAMADTLARRYRSGSPSGGGGPDIGQLLERLPPLPRSELKAGDALMLSLTTGADRALAVMLLAGVEPLLTASPSATRDIMGGWNLGSAGETP